ncbi:TPA: DUF1642 domain-containing protein [Streptococcus suis]|nr:DUF1642 domain-containing protein [Streptococcus suis]
MNKQEAIELLQQMAVEVIDQIHEPQKVVVPKFVAEWIEHCKGRRGTLYFAFTPSRMSRELNEWMALGKNDDIFTRAWLDGYEIKQEKLYTVEIPDPNRPDIATFLYKENGKVFIGTDIFLDEVPNYKWKNEPENQLTESEIKQDFEWAWQFREEVE